MPDRTTEYKISGYVKWFDSGKGFGFIAPDTPGPDVLLHANMLKSCGVSSISGGSYIEVSAIKTERGFQASRIHLIKPPSSDEISNTDLCSSINLDDLVPARAKWFCPQKGYGFVNVFGESDDVFVGSDLLRTCGFESLEAGEAVAIVAEPGERGLIASVVRPWAEIIR